jgi:tetratricopeptide (TPR) repeat protein
VPNRPIHDNYVLLMSTVPTQGTPEAPAGAGPGIEPGSEADPLVNELEALRRKVDDNSAMIRRNQLSLSELAESVGKLVALQRRRERAFSLSSFVAYLLFTVLLGGGFFALYQSRAGELVTARRRAENDLKVAVTHAVALETEIAARDAAADQAHAYWQLLEEGKRDQAIEAYGTLPPTLTPTERDLFAARVKQARGEIVDAGYLAGLDAFRAGKLKDAIPELKRALGYEEEGPRAAQMRYYLGVAEVKTGVHQDGAHQLELALAGRVDESGVVDARYYLAMALEKLGRLGEARTEYDRFATAQPQHPLSVAARRKSAALALRATPRN